jgi:hypothetical protein
VAYNFQTGNNQIKLLTEYESVTQKVLLLIESILKNAKQLQHARLSWHVSGLKIMGNGNFDINLESHCMSRSIYREVTHFELRFSVGVAGQFTLLPLDRRQTALCTH